MQTEITTMTNTAIQNKTTDVRVVKAMATESQAGPQGPDSFRQGDIYITRLDKLPVNLKPAKTNQLAPGTTQGSRHVVRQQEGVTVYARPGDALTGPVIDAPDGCYIEHPEHAHFDLRCGGVFSVTYQRAHAEELRRVAD